MKNENPTILSNSGKRLSLLDKKALIVDDEENARMYLANFMKDLYPELEIQLAASPAEAIFILTKQNTDMIFLDVEMPGITGLEMLKQLRDQIYELPVIFVSTYMKAEFIQKAMRLNAIDYLDKPVNPIELDNAIQKAFKNNISSNHNNKIRLYTEKGELIFEPNEILCFESQKRNSVAYFENDNKKVKVRCNLTELSGILPSQIFSRVSRQFIININKIKYISKSTKSIILKNNNEQFVIQRVYPEVLKNENKNPENSRGIVKLENK